jgi:hypothetical protein
MEAGMSDRATPETDAVWADKSRNILTHSQNLERQRDEVVAERDAERVARKALTKAMESCLRYAECSIAAITEELTAEQVARKALEEALWRSNRECCQVGHTHSDQHNYDAPCPVEARIVAALSLAAKLP